MDVESKRREIQELQARLAQLEHEVDGEQPVREWQATEFYTAYFATTGFMLGMIAAGASLLLNIVGSLFIGQHPLELIRVYLTFPLGDRALELDSGLALAVGCTLYLGTGMLLGVPMYLVLSWLTPNSTFARRIGVVSVLSLAVWLVNYYGVLLWLQPTLVDMSPDNLIVHRVPMWVAALTHLVFGWTLALVYPLGAYVPYRPETEKA